MATISLASVLSVVQILKYSVSMNTFLEVTSDWTKNIEKILSANL